MSIAPHSQHNDVMRYPSTEQIVELYRRRCWALVYKTGRQLHVHRAITLTVGGKVWGRCLEIIGDAVEVSRRVTPDEDYMGMEREEIVFLLADERGAA